MGAWGVGPFQNDDSLDFLGDAEDSGDPVGSVRAALSALGDAEGYVDVSVAGAGLAAAVLVAARSGAPPPDSPQAADWLAAHRFPVDAALRDLARRALERALDDRDNEWAELWADAGRLADARAALAPYRQVLGP